MWGYGQCMDNIKGIINELNSMFSMLIELLTNDSLLQTTTTSLPSLMSAIKATALTLCVMFFLIDFFHKIAPLAVGDLGECLDVVYQAGGGKGLC